MIEDADASLRWLDTAITGARRSRLRAESLLRHRLGDAPAGEVARAMVRCRRAGGGGGDVLGRLYGAAWAEEQALFALARDRVRAHVTWPWLRGVRGIGERSMLPLLARLDATRARTPSAFNAYCGVTSVPASRYECDACGAWLVAALPPRRHRSAEGGGWCAATPRWVGGAGRVARPRAAARYDPAARRGVYLVSVSLVRHPGPYRDRRDARRAWLDVLHPEWPERRRELTALRAVQQLFLLHLWQVWRAALGLPLVAPYAESRLGLRPLPDAALVERQSATD